MSSISPCSLTACQIPADTVGCLKLLPPNSTPLETALEVLTQRLGSIPAPQRDLWNAHTCPPALLPWLAWALSVDSWSPEWPEAVKRAVIAQAIPIARSKGSVRSVRDVVTAFGAQIALREWHQMEPPGEPYTFDLVLTVTGQAGEPASAAFVESVIDEVARTKPARAWFTFTQGLTASSALAMGAAARVAVHRRLQLEAA